MSLPYENATSGEKSMQDIQKLLQGFGCQSFGHMIDFANGELIVQFRYKDTPISVKASVNGYAAAWLKAHPYSYRVRGTEAEHKAKAKQIGAVAVYSILRDWIKGQITAIETGVLSFEGAFLGQILLPTGRTVLEEAQAKKMLPGPRGEES